MAKIYPLGTLLLALCALLLVSCEVNGNDDSDTKILPFSLRSQQNHRNLKRPDHPCVLLRVEVDYEETDWERENKSDEVRCELLVDDIAKADGHYIVPIIGLESGILDSIESGVSTLVADGAVFLDGALHIPQGAMIEFGSIDEYIDESNEADLARWRMLRSRQKNRRLGITGEKKVLVVRADASDASTTANEQELSNNIFGTNGDEVTLKSQYEACSYGKLTLKPYDGTSGVISVELEGGVTGLNKFSVEEAMVKAAGEYFDVDEENLSERFDHVMLCLPPGTEVGEDKGWIAYAYVDSWLAVFNDDWCQQISTQVHEVGHNLGLAHSGKNGDDYSDKSGMMGFSFRGDNAPLQCFNPAKSYELGWYENSAIQWDPLVQGTWFGNIMGVADYDKNSHEQTVVVRIVRKKNNKGDLFVGYNRQKGINSGVVENGDNVIIVEKAEGYSTSNFIEYLHPRSSVSSKKFVNFEETGRNLVVDFSRYGNSIDEAFVAIYFEDCPYPECCRGAMCTQAPTKAPMTTSLESDTTPIIFEIMPNPKVGNSGLYFEIFNPHSRNVNLKNYKICVKKIQGRRRNRTKKCTDLMNFNLDSGEFFMICRNKNELPDSRFCHQEAKVGIRNRKRAQTVTLELVDNNKISVADSVEVPAPKNFRNKVYARNKNNSRCANCWTWSKPA